MADLRGLPQPGGGYELVDASDRARTGRETSEEVSRMRIGLVTLVVIIVVLFLIF
jgi:hypothetical protein